MIGTREFLAVFRRSLLIQASWSYERMQALGFGYAIEPVLRKLYPNKEEYEERVRVHSDYFNTQPYFASFILGAAIRLEHDRAARRTPSADVVAMKSALMGPLGALGDSFFWGSFKPFVAVVAAGFLLTGYWWAPLLFLLAYNTMHVGLRLAFLFWGYAGSGDAVVLVTRYGFTKIAKTLKVASLCVLGGILGVLPAWRAEFKPPLGWHDFLLSLYALGATLLLVLLVRKGLSPVLLMLALAVVCIFLAYTGVIL